MKITRWSWLAVCMLCLSTSLVQAGAGVDELLVQAEAGNPDAMQELAYVFHNGHGVPQDDCRGVSYSQRAAAQGHEKAQWFVAMAYLKGWCVEKDVATGLQLHTRAAEQGNAMSVFTLAGKYTDGDDGVPRDWGKAAYWLKQSFATQTDIGLAVADAFALAYLYGEGGHGLAQDLQESMGWVYIAQDILQSGFEPGSDFYALYSHDLSIMENALPSYMKEAAVKMAEDWRRQYPGLYRQ